MTDKTLQNAKQIYFSLEDNHSREVFTNCLLYSVTGDIEYFKKMPEQGRFNKSTITNFQHVPYISDDFINRIKSAADKKLILYGTGVIGTAIYSLLLKNGLEISCFWDRDLIRQAEGFCGKKVFAPVPAGNEKIIIASKKYESEMTEYLYSLGVAKDDIVLFSYKNYHYDIENQYFDSEIIKFSDSEVFVDGGAYDLVTSDLLISKCPSVKKIYAFEPNEIVSRKLINADYNNIEIIKAGLWSGAGVLKYTPFGSVSSISEYGTVEINVVALDDAVKDEVTFLKMDIEGAELEALKGAEKTIKKYKPKLAICVYHKPEDIIDIPLYIKSIVPEYKLYMRHYTDTFGETVLYAVAD
jgi:FkbM family methyltransferase